jgi:hypothetical protein
MKIRNILLALILLIIHQFPVVAKDTEEMIDVMVITNEKDKIGAKIESISKEAKRLGLGDVVLNGEKTVKKDPIMGNRITILWTEAEYEGETIELDEPFVSEVRVYDDLEEGDKFAAKGQPEELTESLTKLQKKVEESQGGNKLDDNNNEAAIADKEEIENAQNSAGSTSAYLGSSFGSEGGVATEDNALAEVGPNFVVEEDPEEIETSDGCSIRIDLESLQAVIQTRKLKGEKEIVSCADSTTAYQLQKDYNSCPVYADLAQEKVFKQYRLTYKDTSRNTLVQVQDCTLDKDASSDLIRDYQSCGLRHDFNQARSYERYRLTYTLTDTPVIYQDCIDDEKRIYQHLVDSNVCKPEITSKDVIDFERIYIQPQGESKKYLTECTPLKDKYNINEEICSTDKYTHDFVGGQTFLNKSYYYFKGGKRVDVRKCVQSTVSLAHKYDTNGCAVKHDDSKKESYIFAKSYIEDTSLGGKIFIRDCTQINPPAPYSHNKSQWKKRTSTPQTIKGISLPSKSTSSCWANCNQRRVARDCPQQYQKVIRGEAPQRSHYSSAEITSIVSSSIYQATGQWLLLDNTAIDKTLSDQKPTLAYSAATSSCRVRMRGNVTITTTNFGAASCLITNLDKHPIYTRLDGSEIMDTKTVLDSKYVCGTGALLDGKIE